MRFASDALATSAISEENCLPSSGFLSHDVLMILRPGRRLALSVSIIFASDEGSSRRLFAVLTPWIRTGKVLVWAFAVDPSLAVNSVLARSRILSVELLRCNMMSPLCSLLAAITPRAAGVLPSFDRRFTISSAV